VSQGGWVAVTRDRAEQRIATWDGKLYYYNIANAWDYTFLGYMLKFTVEGEVFCISIFDLDMAYG
jgi:hypothetical protein